MQKALDVLREFYEKKKAQLELQAQQRTAPGAGDGKKENKNAPSTGHGGGEYSPNFGASDAILGMLEAVMGDFAKEASEAESAETLAKAEYDKFMTE